MIELLRPPLEVFEGSLEPVYHGSADLAIVFPGFERDDMNLELLSQKADLRVFASPRGRIRLYSVSLPEAPLAGIDLISLMMAVRGQYYDPRSLRDPILEDLGEFRDGRIPPPDTSGIPDHAVLGEYWTEFIDEHLDPLYAAINEPAPQELEVYFRQQERRIMEKEEAMRTLPQLIRNSKRYQSIEEAFENDFWMIRKKDLPSDLRNLSFNDFMAQIRDASNVAIAALIYNLPRKVKEEMIDWPIIPDKIVFDAKKNKPGDVVADTARMSDLDERTFDEYRPGFDIHSDQEREVIYLGDNTLRITYGPSYSTVKVEDGQVKEVERNLVSGSGRALVPQAVWTVDQLTGQKVYLNSNLPKQVRTEPNGSTLVGLGLAAWLSPSVRLPERLGLRGSDSSQDMTGAQVLMTASLMRKRLLEKGEFFPVIEDHVRQAA